MITIGGCKLEGTKVGQLHVKSREETVECSPMTIDFEFADLIGMTEKYI